MKVMAINGSPRKNRNTATLLQSALDGAASRGAETKLVQLYDLEFKGCVSCFACKLKGGKSYGTCARRDGLTPVLEEAAQADALILGSPIYFYSVTGEMRSFLERLLFPYSTYSKGYRSIFGRTIPTAFIYTMNITAAQMEQMGYTQSLGLTEAALKRIFGRFESLPVCDTYQFDDYSRYEVTVFDEGKKRRVKEEQFPEYRRQAFELGASFAE